MKYIYLIIFGILSLQLWAQNDLTVINYNEAKSLNISEKYISPNGTVLVKKDYYNNLKSSDQINDDLDQLDGWPLTNLNGTAARASRAFDLNGDGINELIFSSGYYIHVYDLEGEPMPGWPNISDHVITGAPVIGNIDNDPEPEIVVCSSNYGSYGELYAYNLDGSLLPGFPIVMEEGAPQHEPLLENIDGDPEYEILINVRAYPYAQVIAYNGDGSIDPYWEDVILDYIPGCALSSGDITGDGVPEIIACSFWALYAFDIKANILEGFPFVFEQDVRAVSYSNPVLADIDEDGLNEIIVGTCNQQPTSDAGAVFVINEDGSIVDGWPQYVWRWIFAPVAVADLDMDGHLDILVGDQTLSPYPDDYVYAWNAIGEPLYGFPKGGMEAVFCQATIGDLNNDNDLEIILDHNVYGIPWQIIHHYGAVFEDFEIENDYSVMMTSVMLKDINGDGLLNIMAADNDMNEEESDQNIYNVDIPFNPLNVPLGTFQYNSRNTGEYGITDIIIGVDESKNVSPKILVYPNPFIQAIHITGLDLDKTIGQFLLFNSLGELVFSKEINISDHIQIDLTNKLSTGVYFYSIKMDQTHISGKISH